MPIGFDARAYLPRDLYDGITDIRVRQPSFADGEADRRARRRVAAPDGKLVILAADHPGRASLRIQDDPLAMADRHELLARIVRVLSHAGIDGVMSTPGHRRGPPDPGRAHPRARRAEPARRAAPHRLHEPRRAPGHGLGDGRQLHRLHHAPDGGAGPGRREAHAADRPDRPRLARDHRGLRPGGHRAGRGQPPGVPGAAPGRARERRLQGRPHAAGPRGGRERRLGHGRELPLHVADAPDVPGLRAGGAGDHAAAGDPGRGGGRGPAAGRSRISGAAWRRARTSGAP